MAAPHDCELLVVGGGINGAGIARDAAGRGLSVLLCEQHDLASHTSAASTKLVHGGLRYLEHYEFGLVRKALAERETLLASAPHIMWPLEFVLPHDAHLRPAWLIRLGLWFYDHLAARRSLPRSRAVDLQAHPAGAGLQPRFRRGYTYADGWVDDARLVVLNAVDAAERGARILTRTRCAAIAADGDGWRARLEPEAGPAVEVRARAVVNAAGPWAGTFRRQAAGLDRGGLRLIKGSHIVVPALFDHGQAYLFQTEDRRVVFAIPYESRYTLIGTTDVEYHGDPADAACSDAECEYLCAVASRYLRKGVQPADVVWRYSGVRPLQRDESADPSGISRDYELVADCEAPLLLSVLGGKITTYRRLAEEAVDRLAPALGTRGGRWTARTPLPGGDLGPDGLPGLERRLGAEFPWLADALRRRLARAYGTRARHLLAGAARPADLGEEILPGLHAREVRYLIEQEWARGAEDILWRRSKLGLHLGPGCATVLETWMRRQAA